ncbi:Hsp20/alpha crystallin family protein [PVC group bacterium]|nr:Hsp20/alpha crystallin family protein [PVC group bacterium]
MNYLARVRRNPWNLWDELDNLQNAVSRSFVSNEDGGAVLCPRMDAWEADDKLVVELELPGVAKEDVDISVIGNELTVSGKSEHGEEEKDATYHRRERRYSEFSRTVTLPYEPDAEKVTAASKDGVLTISIPQPAKTKPKKITVKAA